MLDTIELFDPSPVTMAIIRERLPAELYAEFRLSLLSAKERVNSSDPAERIFADEVLDIQTALASGGFLLHTPERLAMLDEMAPKLSWSAELLDALRRITVITKFKWQLAGRASAPTIETIAAEIEAEAQTTLRNDRAEQFRAVREQWIAAYGEALRWLNAAESGAADAPTLDELLGHLKAN